MRTRMFIAGAALVLAASSALAQNPGRYQYDYDTGGVQRGGASCRLTIDGDEEWDGTCDVSVNRQTGVTTIFAGSRIYKIERTGDGEGVFYKGRRPIDFTIRARGSCWRGDSVTFCAS